MQILLSDSTWVPVPGFEQFYLLNKMGEVKSLHKRNNGGLMAVTIRRGYKTVQLSNGKKTRTILVHRILALAFIPKPEGKDFVNHKNFNRLDNGIENLEWVTASENMKHAHQTGLLVPVGQKKPVVDICSGRKYGSAKEAAEALSMNYKTLLSDFLNHPFVKHCLQYMDDSRKTIINVT